MYERLFALANPAVAFWLLLMLLPGWRVTRFLANTAIFPVYLAVLYVVGIASAAAASGFGFMSDYGSAEGVTRLLSNTDFALLVWIHVLCFDQAVGHYIYRDNMKHRYVPLPVQSVLLFCTLMFGPLGFLGYIGLRSLRQRSDHHARADQG